MSYTIVLISVFIVAVLSTIYIHLDYASRMPSAPRPEVGRIYRMTVNHGTVVYVTRDEFKRAHVIVDKLFLVGMAAFFILMLSKLYSQGFRAKNVSVSGGSDYARVPDPRRSFMKGGNNN